MRKGIIAGISAILLSAFILFTIIGAGVSEAVEDAVSRLEPVNPDFVRYVESKQRGEALPTGKDGFRFGYVPAPQDLSHVRGTIDAAVKADYPAYFDLRQVGTVTYVKDQGQYFLCWTFSAYASLESCMLPDEVLDFSEWHLSNYHGFDYTLTRGGNSWVTAAYLTRWSGPVDEWRVPYPTQAAAAAVGDDYPLSKHVQQVIFLPERTGPLDNDTVKYFVTNWGPVDFAMYWEFNNYNSRFASQYSPPPDPGQNHRLAIVGWDDDYPASRFLITPPGDGAFIARNSWGTGWGDGGYCYISYYDVTLEEFTCFNNVEPSTNYENVYYHDRLGRTSAWGWKDTWGANVFTAVNSRSLKAVGFYTNDSNVNYEIHVYKYLDPDGDNPVAGTHAAFKTGTFIYPGYYTVELDDLVPLSQGEKFSVVMRWINPEHPYSVPIETRVPEHSSGAVAGPGESYVSRDGIEWNDTTDLFANTNVCIKAYSEAPKAVIHLQVVPTLVNAWLISRVYATVTFNIANLDDVNITSVYLYRNIQGGENEELLHISPDQLVDGSYRYEDYFLDPGIRCTYRVITYDANGLVTGRSNEVTI
jgi:C1A family cysteine protease